MTLKKIKNFSETREAGAFAEAIGQRVSGAAEMGLWREHKAAPLLKHSVVVA